jgi:competence protein ComEA
VERSQSKHEVESIMVDVAGAVKKPGIYELVEGSRVKDALQKADGFSQDLDFTYVSKTLNQAKVLADQDKIYIPTRSETLLTTTTSNSPSDSSPELINLNTAEMEELDKLPSIGAVTAQKIISGRPYSNLQELVDKKILGPSTFEKIQSLVTIY